MTEALLRLYELVSKSILEPTGREDSCSAWDMISCSACRDPTIRSKLSPATLGAPPHGSCKVWQSRAAQDVAPSCGHKDHCLELFQQPKMPTGLAEQASVSGLRFASLRKRMVLDHALHDKLSW